MTDPTADWQEWPTDVECRERDGPWAQHMMQCYRERLRDTAEALRDEHSPVDCERGARCRTCAILARLEQEGPA